MLQRAKEGELPAFAFVADVHGAQPLVGVTGAYRRDACRAIGGLVLMQRRLCRMHERQADNESTLGGGLTPDPLIGP